MIITKKALPRRTFLRGIGAAMALPLLDSMVPALAAAPQASAQSPTRLSFVYIPNGVIMDKWTPPALGSNYPLPPILEPLAPFRDDMLVLSGLAHNTGWALEGEGPGEHARASATFLTSVHPKKTEGADLRAGTSIDQIVAREFRQHTQLASLELALDSTDPIAIRSVGAVPPRRSPWRTSRERYSNGCSATVIVPIRPCCVPEWGRTVAFSTW
jgi:hypothetical protein